MDENASLELLVKSALPVDDVDQLQMGPRDGIAVIWVDTSERPDLQILAEKNARSGGYAVCTWFYGNPSKLNMIIGLRVEMKQPTRNAFQVVLKVERYLDQLSLIAQSGKLWIVPGPPLAHLVGKIEMNARTFIEQVIAYSGEGLFIELEPHLVAELQSQLTTWKRNR
jgi:hypothetical protein